MNWLRKNPLFAGVLVMCVGTIAAEIWQLQTLWQRTKRAEVMLRQRKDERDWLAHRTPALSAENTDAIAADVAVAARRLDELRQALQGRGRWLTAPPKRPIDAYFALAAFTEKTRALAVQQQVELRPDERFGFGTYASVGPAAEHISAVHRQRVLVEHLLETLLEARPRALLSVQREHPRTAASHLHRAEASEPDAGAVAADFFEFPAHVRMGIPGVLETEAFRLEFTGQTQTLRALLNALAVFKLPLIVRSVEVEALPGDSRLVSATGSSGSVPIVAQNLAKFAVVVEFVALANGLNPAQSP